MANVSRYSNSCKTPVGGLYSNLTHFDLALPFDATYGFLLTLALMDSGIAVAARLCSRRPWLRGDNRLAGTTGNR